MNGFSFFKTQAEKHIILMNNIVVYLYCIYMGHSTKVKEFELIFFAKNNTAYLDFVNFNLNSEQLIARNHSSRQENLHNNACVGLL